MYNLNTACKLGITITLLLGIVEDNRTVLGKGGQVRERNIFSGKMTITLFYINHWFFFLYSEVRELRSEKQFLSCLSSYMV